MSRRPWSVLIAAISLMIAASGTIAYLQGHQSLGVPGVTMTNDVVRSENGEIIGQQGVYLPSKVLNYNSEILPIPQVVCNWLPKDTSYGQRRYTAPDGFLIDNNVVLMKADRSSIHQPRYCLPAQGWHIDSEETTKIPIQRPIRYDLEVVKVLALKSFKDRQGRTQSVRGTYVYWFVADDELTANHKMALGWMLARDLVTKGVMQRWAYVSFFSVCPVGAEEATFDRMKQFIAAAVPEFQITVGEVKTR